MRDQGEMSASNSSPAVPPVAMSFAADLNNVARALRASLSSLMTSVGLDPEDPQALAKQWGVNRQLSWKVAKIVQIRDPFVALQHLPGNEGMEILLKKGEAAGAPARAIDAARQAAAEFDRMVERHCGERAIFDIMGSELSSAEAARQQQEALRKQFFLGASSIWGAQVKVNLVSWFVAPSPGSGGRTMDAVSIKGWLGFRRLRENLSWVVSRHMSRHDDGTPNPIGRPEPLDAGSDWRVPLVRAFCSDPVPEISVKEEGGRATVSLAPGPVGNVGLTSCVLGKINRGLPHAPTPQDRNTRLICDLSVPSEVTVFDLFVHESMTYAMPPGVVLASLIEPREPDMERNRMPLHEELQELGSAATAPLTLEVPRYGEMLEMAFGRAGWRAGEFVGYRVKMAYPPLPAVLMMTYPLPG